MVRITLIDTNSIGVSQHSSYHLCSNYFLKAKLVFT